MELLLVVFLLEQALALLVGALSLGTSEVGDKGGGMKVFRSVAAGLARGSRELWRRRLREHEQH